MPVPDLFEGSCIMDQVTFYLAAHAVFAMALAVAAAVRLRQSGAGLIEWVNDALNIGVVFILVLAIVTPQLG